MQRKLLLYLSIFLLTVSSGLYAGTTGKITGKVVDQETGETLPGINIILEGTTLGAATGIDGTFMINNIPPGKYNVIVSGVGFQKQKFVDVKVVADFTTRLDVKMSTEVISTEEVVVRAEAPLVRKDLTSSHTSVDAEQIESLPVEGVTEILTLQAGITQGTGGELHIRGGRSTEIAFTVNGVSMTNPYNNSNSVSIATNAIQELSVVSGTFNAEYGNALSGIVNTVTKEGGNNYKGSVSFYTGDYLSSNDDVFYNIGDINPMNSHVAEMTLGGPFPMVSPEKLTFFVSGRFSKSDGYLYGIRQHLPTDSVYKNQLNPDDIVISANGDNAVVSMNPSEYYSATGKLTFKPFTTMKINYDAIYSRSEYQSYSHAYKYNPDAHYNNNDWGLLNSLEVRHALSNRTFYTLRGSFNLSDFSQYMYPLVDASGNPVDFHAGMELDLNKYFPDPRYQPEHKNSSAANYTFVSGGTRNGHFYQRTYTYGGKFDITSQLNNSHEVKFGVDYKNHDISYETFTIRRDSTGAFPEPTIMAKSSQYRDSYSRNPIEFSSYIQDKMEFNNIIVNLGVRFDYFDVNAKYSTDKFNPSPNAPVLPTNIDTLGLLTEADAKYQISPRLGVSFPITDKGIIHFSYGHFFQMPPFSYLYANPDFEYTNTGESYGNANLKPEKTVTYEIGLQQELAENLAMHVTGYYKDVRDLLASQPLRISEDRTYSTYVNKDYANIRGLILSINKRRTNKDMLGFSLDYTFQVAEGNDTNPDKFFLDLNSGSQSEKEPVPLGWDKSHQLNATVSVGAPNDWNVTLVGRIGTGLPYDPILFENQVYLRANSGRRPSQTNVDLMAEKSFNYFGLGITVFTKISNLFDNLNENLVYGSTGRSGYTLDSTLPTAKTTDELATQIPGLRPSSEYFRQPHYYLPPREVRVGFSVDF